MALPISTTMPFGSSFSDMKATATVNVAPCSACAGPKTSPLNEWAIMMWSDTSTAYTATPRGSDGIADELAQRAARGMQDIRQPGRQVAQPDSRRQQGVQHRIVQEVERGGKTAAIVPTRPVRGRDLADLAGNQPQAPGMKAAA